MTAAGTQALINAIAFATPLNAVSDPGPATPPTVANSAATNVGAASATIGGQVTDTGGEDPTVLIYWGDNNGGTSPGTWDNSIALGTHNGSFSSNLTGLNPSTTYFFRCFAANSGGDSWASSTLSFTTPAPPNPPTVVNSPAGNVGFTSAEIGGQVTATGGENPTVLIYWGDSNGGTTPGSWDQFNDLSTQAGAFEDALANLTDGVTYYFRSFASNSGGSDWAPSSESFTTLTFGLASLTNSAATNVTGVSAQINGAVTATGGDSPLVEIHYGTTNGGTNPGSWDTSVSIGTQSGSFSTALSSLAANTTYFFTASGSNIAGQGWATPSLSFTTPEVSDLVINEFMASNGGGTPVPNQVPGTTDDWIELHNQGTTTLSLAGWHLTDSAGNLNKWTFPPGITLPMGDFLVVFASGNNALDANGNLHTNFSLSAGGEYVALVRPSLTVASEFGPSSTDYPSQQSDISYGLHPSNLESVYFQTPTPDAPNDAGGQLLVEDTQFSHKRGYYTSPINLSLTTNTSGATIRYTLDGTVPTQSTNGSTYSSAIPINTTTVLRVRAFKSGLQATRLDTQSYIFPNSVVTQTRPSGYPTSWGGEPTADYNMDTQITRSSQYAARFLEGLRDIPTLSVTGEEDDFFGSDGIYVDTQDRNIEAAVSAEYFHPDAVTDGINIEDGFQIDCGCKLQGGASRTPSKAIKHSFSLRFRDLYGAGKLNYPVFDGTTVTTFDSIHLRAMYNNSWIHSNSGQRARATMIRDQWARDCMIDMGNADGGQGHFVHFYINGIYWGVFNLHERLENDHYAAYNGYEDDEVLGLNPGRLTSEETASFNAMKAVVTNSRSTWSRIQTVLDVDNYIDFVITEYFGRNADLKSGDNWRAAGGGSANAPWRFYCWDTERILENQTTTSAPSNSGALDGALIFDDLEDHREFRVRFADRAYKHLFHGGALTNLENRGRFQNYADQIDTAIVCESARWGDDRSGGGFSGNYARNENWTRAVYGTPGGPGTSPSNGVLGSWFPTSGTNRTDRMISAWQSRTFSGSSDTYLGTITAPLFTVNGGNQHGGEIPGGGTLSATAPSGSIYYTTDGTDPRLEGGSLAPGAILLSGEMSLPASGLVRMRARVGGGDSWSPLSEAIFYLERRATASDLRITEINYNAVRANAVEAEAGANLAIPRLFTGGDFEFVEICNVSASAVNLDGMKFTNGLTFTFPVTNLPAGGYVVVVKDREAFEVRYGTGLPVAGQFTGTLDNGGERIAFATWNGTGTQDFTFDDGGTWPGRANGIGSSLEIINTAGDYGNSENWRSSCEYNGSPGALGAGLDGRIVVNEILTNTDLPAIDRIELHNTTGASIPVANWYLSDANTNYRKFRISSGSIPAGEYLDWDESDFNANQNLPISSYSGTIAAAPTTVSDAAHGLSTGDVITISGYGGIGAYNDTFEVTVPNANSFTIPVPFLDNHGTKGTYTSGEPFALSSQGDDVWLLEGDASGKLLKFVDRVEFAAAFNGDTLGRWPNGAGTGTLVTMTANTIGSPNSGPLVGPVVISEVMYHPDATIEDNLEYVELCNTGSVTENLVNWTLRGGVDFEFTAAHELAPGDILVVVGFDPVVEANATSAFRATYGIDASIPLMGPWTDGPLNNDTGTVRLQRPDVPSPGDPTNFPQVTEDEVIYFNTTPWPEDADGNGESLNRTGLDLFGNFSASWNATGPTPGVKRFDYASYRDLTFGPGMPPGSGELEDFDIDGIPNLIEFALGLDPLVFDANLLPGVVVEGGSLSISYNRNNLLSGITYQVQVSTDLITWNPVPDVLVSTQNFIEVRKASVPTSPNGRQFMRIAITH
ncbi:MAG: lamin tail domain-containing protein [Roseibacillus sp.]|nr:lamin tail domain-containing protein [Roseibacillus sp.]